MFLTPARPSFIVTSLMKKLLLSATLAVAALTLLLFAGCGGEKVSTSKLESSFSSAEAATKAEVQKAVDSIKAKDYASALVQLQKVYARAKLTPEQREAIKTIDEQLRELIVKGANESVEKVAGEANKKVEDLKQK